jgi:hypothetical protein
MEDDEFRRLVAQVNTKLEQILNRLTGLEQDFQNTKGFLVGDAVVSSRRWLDLDERVSRLERDRKD